MQRLRFGKEPKNNQPSIKMNEVVAKCLDYGLVTVLLCFSYGIVRDFIGVEYYEEKEQEEQDEEETQA